MLRLIYPSGFVLMGVHEEEGRRLKQLTENKGISEKNARELIQRDSEEAKVPHGQRVNKTFHLADFFVRIAESHDQLRCDVKRIVELWFGNPFITPTFDEHAMFLAFSAGLARPICRDKLVLSWCAIRRFLQPARMIARKRAAGYIGRRGKAMVALEMRREAGTICETMAIQTGWSRTG